MENNKQGFQKYYKRLMWEGIIKSLICGFIVGFAVDFVIAFITWFTVDFNGLWLAIGAGVAFAAGFTVLFYFKKFRPTTKQVAARIDSLGFEERMITMAEFENDDSYIAMRQREDAKAKLSMIDSKSIAFHVSLATIIAVAILGVMGISMTTVTALSAEGKIASGKDVIETIIPPDPDKFYEVTYMVEGEGYIEGDAEQVVKEGESTTMVLAVAEEGWAFAYWDDGTDNEDPLTDPERIDENVRENLVFTAVFMELEEGDGENGDGDGEGDDSQDSASDAPGDPSDSDPSEGNSEDSNPDSSNPGDGSSGSDANDNNNVVDGDTYYGDVYDVYYDQSQGDKSDDGLSGDKGDFLDGYWSGLH